MKREHKKNIITFGSPAGTLSDFSESSLSHGGGLVLGIDTLCRHNFEHNRYIWEFENNARIIGRNSGIIHRYPSSNTTLNAHVQ